MNLKPAKIIAVDFDGTLCENKWPEIGAANEELIEYIRDRQKNGDKLILWTCRVDDMLQKAIEWCRERGLIFDAVNENLPEIIENFGSDTRKIFANEYIDDRNIWPLENGVADVLYLCDSKSCGDTCLGVECKHTSDIAHARNFIKGDHVSFSPPYSSKFIYTLYHTRIFVNDAVIEFGLFNQHPVFTIQIMS